MNLYLIVALALGSVAGATAAPVAQTLTASVVHLECGGRAAALRPQERQHGCRTPESTRCPARRPLPAARMQVLTGAATPRAPSRG